MLLYRITNCRHITDLSGYGAFLTGGRWNSEGTYMIYTSQSIALSMLEVLANIPRHLAKQNFCLLVLELQDDEAKILSVKNLPNHWDIYPHVISTRTIGDNFVENQESAALKVPSAVVPEEYNVLLNPRHPNFTKKVKIISHKTILIDKRLVD